MKIPKGQSEVVNYRRTDNAMAKRNVTNNADLQNIHIKLKIGQQEPPPTKNRE